MRMVDERQEEREAGVWKVPIEIGILCDLIYELRQFLLILSRLVWTPRRQPIAVRELEAFKLVDGRFIATGTDKQDVLVSEFMVPDYP